MRRMLCSVVVLSVCFPLVFAAPAADDIVRRMDEAQKNMTAARFTYRQEVAYALTGERQVMTGTVLFGAPDRMVVLQKAPVEQRIISNGKKVWVYTPAYRQVLVTTYKEWTRSGMIPASLARIGPSGKGLRASYDITLSSETAEAHILTLAPRAAGEWRMDLTVDRRTLLPTVAVLRGENVSVTLTAADWRLNEPLSKDTFVFVPPAGVEEIRLP